MPLLRSTLALLAAVAPVLPARADAPKPNVVFLLADDLGRADVGFMGGRDIPTPNLDRLAQAGAILDQFYVQPVCSPTRAALLTGRYPMRHGLQVGVVRPWANYGLPLEERTLPQALREAGYQTAIVGKWHLGAAAPVYLPTRRGFDRQYGHYNGAIDYFTHDRDGGHDWHRNDRASRDEGYSTHLIAREAVRVIRERDPAKPLFLYVPFNAVHSPWQVPERYLQPFGHLQGNRRIYAGMLACLDEAVGQIRAAIDEAGLRPSTLFVFASDNGGPSPGTITDNGPLRAGKGTLYEGGTRVCAFATWEGRIPAGSRVNQPLHMVDWYPTLLQLAGAPLPQPRPVDGRDVWATLARGEPSPRTEVLYNTSPTGGALRRGDWKLVLNGRIADREAPDQDTAANARKKQRRAEVESVELFNLAADPGERTNLAAQHPDTVAELKARLQQLAAEALPPKSQAKPAGFVVPKVWGE